MARYRPVFATVLLVFMSLPAATANADPITGEVKWSQLPDMGRLGFDYSSQRYLPGTNQGESLVADDFVCTDARPVIDVHWWGSYWRPTYATSFSNYAIDPSFTAGGIAMPETVLGFIIRFYDHVPIAADPSTTTMPYGHPGTMIYEAYVPMGAVASNQYGEPIDRTGDGVIGNAGDEVVWQYSTVLETPFEQAAGTVYWLSIQAVTEDPAVQWGWHAASELRGNNAVQGGPSDLWGTPYRRPWVLMVDKDMAFELTVPEPATSALAGAGLAVLLMSRRRRRR